MHNEGLSPPAETKAVRASRLPAAEVRAFTAVHPDDADYPRAVVDYYCQQFLIQDRQVMQVYEELVGLAYWLRGFAPRNIMEIGTVGATFFVLTRLATGKKVAIDIRDVRARLHGFMFGHDWCFFQGDSQTAEMRDKVSAYCAEFDLIFIDGDHRYVGVKSDFENYRGLLSDRGVLMFHDVDPEHVFKKTAAGEVWRFWNELDEGSKINLCCSRSNGRVEFLGKTAHFGGIGIWSPK